MTVYSFVNGITPGPNNILLLSVTSRYGLKRSLKLMAGMWTGVLSIMILCCLLCSGLTKVMPQIKPVLKVAGALYILYLAVKTLMRKGAADKDAGDEPKFFTGLIMQFLNFKIIIYGLTCFSSYILPHTSAVPLLLALCPYLVLGGAFGNVVWAVFGSFLKPFYNRHVTAVNIVMALLLVWCSVRIILA